MLPCMQLSRIFTLCDVLLNLNLLTLTVDIFFTDFTLAEHKRLCMPDTRELMEENNPTEN